MLFFVNYLFFSEFVLLKVKNNLGADVDFGFGVYFDAEVVAYALAKVKTESTGFFIHSSNFVKYFLSMQFTPFCRYRIIAIYTFLQNLI